MSEQETESGMHKRRITLDDGRYMIFYTFDDLPSAVEHERTEGVRRPEPEAKPEAEEERRV